MRRLNLDYLRTFALVIEHGSFSAAADRLGLSQPAVSLQVRQLERQLGATLVERVGRRALPTAAGADLLAHAGSIEAAVCDALAAVGRHVTGSAGRVRIGTGATACIFLLPPILRGLRKMHPAMEITVTTGNTSDIVAAVEENRIDVGLVTLPAASRALEITPVLEDEFQVIAPADMDLPAQVTAEALAGVPLVLFEPGGNTRRLVDAWCAARAVRLRPIMSLGSVEAIKELVWAGLGCAILPGMAVVQGERPDRPLTVRPLAPRLHRTLATVVRRDKRLTPALRETLAALTDPAQRPGRHG
ncbi:MAG: LysR family transcriptional regulator [Pseudomonadota bacterium]